MKEINVKTAKKLHDLIIKGRFLYEMNKYPIDQFCLSESRKHNGYVKTQLKRIAKLGPVEAEKMTLIYLQQWDAYNGGL